MKTAIIVVTYEPDFNNLKRLVACVQKAEGEVIIVDNSEKNRVSAKMFESPVCVVDMNGNQGIAKAQNKGIEVALARDADIVGFFDQDSVIRDTVIKTLSEEIKKNKNIVVAPVAIDAVTKCEYPAQIIKKSGLPKDVFVREASVPIKVDIVISSGMFVSRSVIEKVGSYDEDLFIDFVDIEWCIRCKRRGIQIYELPTVILEHRIGCSTKKIGPFHVLIHSPYRTYYKVRNSFLMLRKKRCGVLFALRQIASAVLMNFFLVFGENGRAYLKYYYFGIYDGIFGKVGKYSHEL